VRACVSIYMYIKNNNFLMHISTLYRVASTSMSVYVSKSIQRIHAMLHAKKLISLLCVLVG
jgi:hypothetical protein